MPRKRKPKTRGPKGGGYTTFDKARGKYKAVYAGRSRLFTDESAADAWRKEQARLAATPVPAGQLQSLAAALHEFLTTKRTNRSGTKRTHASLARTIVDTIGDIPVGTITQTHIAKMDEQLRSELSVSTCEQILGLLNSMFRRLVILEVLPRNPIEQYRTITPKRARGGREAREPVALSASQVRALLDALEGHEYQPFFTWLCVLPFRISELRGLRWANVDTLRRTVAIVEQRTNRTPDATPPKSKDGIRKLPLPAQLLTLTPHDESALGLVFPNANGNARLDSTISKHFNRALKKAELPLIHIHDLRHTAASGLLNSGCPPHIVAAFLGHAPAGITLHYARPELETLRPHIETWCSTVLDKTKRKIIKIGA